MPLQEYMKLISVDDHVVEHPRVWLDRLPARYHDMGPHVVEVSERLIDETTSMPIGPGQAWSYEGELHSGLTLNAQAGRRFEDYGKEPMRFDEVIPGCYDPKARIRDLDEDGIQAQLCFPSFPRFAGTRFLRGKDKELSLLCVQAYNDYILDEWCAADRTRFIPLVIIPLWDPALAVAEIERTAARGAKSISFPENLPPLGLPSWHTDHWDPVFAAAQDADLTLSIHFGTSGTNWKPSKDSPNIVNLGLTATALMDATVDLIFSQVFHKFPRLRVAMSEGGIGWIPYILEHIDFVWTRHRHYNLDVNQDVKPSELFAKHIWGCFIEDKAGLEERHLIGVNKICWECDYPHSDTNWPTARKQLAEQVADIPDDEVHRIVELNARDLYRFDADL